MTVNTISLKLFSASYCQRCAGAKKQVENLVSQINEDFPSIYIDYQEVDVVSELDLAVEIGILTTPSLVLNSVLIFSAMPSINKLRDVLLQSALLQGGEE